MSTLQPNEPRYEVIVQEDPETGDLWLPIPPELLAKLGWKDSDNFVLSFDQDGNYIIQRDTK